MSEVSINSSLNIRQKEAVETLEGPLLIVAGAGAGKTKTITHRILNLIKSGVKPSEILAITFTNKAAKEMRERVFHLIAEDKTLNVPISFNERPFMSTFHALGVHENSVILSRYRHQFPKVFKLFLLFSSSVFVDIFHPTLSDNVLD